jgi:hypothetical protein
MASRVGAARRIQEGGGVLAMEKRTLAIYVDRSVQRWVVRDPEGNFWILPPGEDSWGRRMPFLPVDESGLEPVPGHYKNTLGLPF